MPPFGSSVPSPVGGAPPISKPEEQESSSCLPVRRVSGGSSGKSLSSIPFSMPKLQFPTLSKSTVSSFVLRTSAGGNMRPGALEATAVAEGEPRLAPELLASFAYDELLVLVHGLQGTAEDFTFFEQQLQQSAAASAGQLLIHVTDVNTERTHDGIVEGGMRLAEDIQRVVAENPSLNGISLVGFSLGGMYARYAAALLYDDATSTVAGLTPITFATVASPNLGVRRFGVFRLIPQPLFGATKFLFGQTGDDLVMNGDTDEPLVVSMSKDRNPLGLPFLTALRSFSRRYLYGNMRHDFMVNWGTSVLDASVDKMSGNDVHAAIHQRAAVAGAEPIDHDFDSKGCKIAFTYAIPGREVSDGASSVVSEGDHRVEKQMAERLQSVGWQVVGIDLPMPLPFAHNRIMAMSRGPIHTWMNAPGRRAVLHMVDTLVGTFENHERMFEPVLPGESTTLSSDTPFLLHSTDIAET